MCHVQQTTSAKLKKKKKRKINKEDLNGIAEHLLTFHLDAVLQFYS